MKACEDEYGSVDEVQKACRSVMSWGTTIQYNVDTYRSRFVKRIVLMSHLQELMLVPVDTGHCERVRQCCSKAGMLDETVRTVARCVLKSSTVPHPLTQTIRPTSKTPSFLLAAGLSPTLDFFPGTCLIHLLRGQLHVPPPVLEVGSALTHSSGILYTSSR